MMLEKSINEVYKSMLANDQQKIEIDIPGKNEKILMKIKTKTPEDLIKDNLYKDYQHLKCCSLTTKMKNIFYGENILTDYNYLLSTLWMYSRIGKVVLCVPKYTLSVLHTAIEKFNIMSIKVEEYYIIPGKDFEIVACELETFENLKISKNKSFIFIMGFADFSVNSIISKNKRRFITQFKKIKELSQHILLFSSTSMKYFDMELFDDFGLYKFQKTPMVNYNSFLEYSTSVDDLNSSTGLHNIISLVTENVKNNKKVYMCLELEVGKLKYIESKLKEVDVIVTRKEEENSQVVINSSKTAKVTLLEHKYDCYVYYLHDVNNNCIDLLEYFKFISDTSVDIYLDEMNIDFIERNIFRLSKIENSEIKRFKIFETSDFNTYDQCVGSLSNGYENVSVIENYVRISGSENIRRLNLSSLSCSDYKTIREYVLFNLEKKGYENIKTCQLVYPCSPVDRSRKLNSLSNKISSFDYRCDVTCEIFRDYTIGIVIWSELFSNRKSLDYNSLINNNYVYRTTSGNWKCTTVEFKKNN